MYSLNSYSEAWSGLAATFIFCLFSYSDADVPRIVTHLGRLASRSRRDFISPMTDALHPKQSEEGEVAGQIYLLLLVVTAWQYQLVVAALSILFCVAFHNRWGEGPTFVYLILACCLNAYSEAFDLIPAIVMGTIASSPDTPRQCVFSTCVAIVLSVRSVPCLLFFLSLAQLVASYSEIIYFFTSLLYCLAANLTAGLAIATFFYASLCTRDLTSYLMLVWIAEIGFSSPGMFLYNHASFSFRRWSKNSRIVRSTV